jgi:hypothetical protein
MVFIPVIDIYLKHYNGISTTIRIDSEYSENELIKKMEESYVKFNKKTDYYLKNNNTIFILKKMFNVKSQYDEPYNNIENQCSWISKEFIKCKDEFIDSINNNFKSIKSIYEKCLINGTKERELNFKLIQGENIDEVNINDIEFKSTSNIDINIIQSILGEDIFKLIYKENIPYTKFENFLNEIKNLENNKMVIVNRDGQSFVSLKYKDEYIIFDSHIREIKFLNYNEFIMYLYENNMNGLFYFIYGFK